MPLFRITKKLATAIETTLPKRPVEHESVEHEWFADLFYIERRQCLVWVHRATLLGFVRPALVAADLRQFHTIFQFEFFAAIAALGLPASLIG